MQCTPLISYHDTWSVEVENLQDTRSNSMLWTRYGSQDDYIRWGPRGEMMVPTAKAGIEFATRMGWDYEVIYTKDRFHQLKSYAENFAFKKEEMSDTEEGDIKFDRI